MSDLDREKIQDKSEIDPSAWVPMQKVRIVVVDQHGKEHKPIDDTGIYLVPAGTILKPKKGK